MLLKDQSLNQGRYRIINGIGQDETEAIYECFDESAKVKVLIKEILFTSKKVVSASESDQLREHFVSKARKMLELNHDSLLKVSDYFSEIDRFYLVTEFSEGNNLNKLLEKAKCSFALSNVLNWADQLLFVLNYLHTQAKPLFHNGIKPQNLRLTVEGKLKIFPMCIAANADANGGSSHQTTDSAQINYLPLERIWDRLDPASQSVITKTYDEKSEKILQMPADARSDVYSLGATLYHLAAGQAPIDALTRSIELLEGKSDPLPSLHELNPAIPQEVSDVFMKALEIKREERFDSAVIMRQVLRTSLLRAKERQTNEAKKAVSVPKEIVVETKSLKLENVSHAENFAPIKTEKAKPAAVENSVSSNSQAVSHEEIEQMKKRLREAEEERIKAEKRAAEAERLLLQHQALKADMMETPELTHEAVEIIEEKEEFPEILSAEIIYETENEPQTSVEEKAVEKAEEKFAETFSQTISNDDSSEFGTLFAQPEPKGGVMAKVAGAGLLLAAIGGGVWGYFNFVAPKAADQNISVQQNLQAQPPAQTAVNEKPAAENQPAPIASPTVEAEKQTVAETAPVSDEKLDAPKPADKSPAKSFEKKSENKAKPEASPVADKEKKPSLASSKTPEPKKKSVTMDDLLNGN